MDHVRIVGVLNVTPDSYFDGGRHASVELAVKRAGKMLSEGAAILEIGGESTGPGSKDISVDEELARVLPAIRAIREAYPEAVLSIDTWKSRVAEEAIEAGVSMVNDVTAGRSDLKIFSVVKKRNIKIVLMYAKDASPRTTVSSVKYTDVVETIIDFLSERKAEAIASGIKESHIILDPGLGHFVSSDAKYSFEILARLSELRALGCPLFVSPSRKSFLAGRENLPHEERLPGTIAASAVAVLHGASYIRTHDVVAVRRGCEVAIRSIPSPRIRQS